ncbi:MULTISPECIES: GIY-YIG nuclease family protein [unclassified Rhodococcus (in: high G+C Gram-positive bacteria)]|uniref:GIY-YIG nuclease family protein n=1 Tax=unclassified Rhodococcus (in: high G+C Gram-positive bacteria) TaxID=192944 RepID=UPI000AB0FDE6|nr:MULTISPECIES: GIY-YIG nuclease family protein [unclassified Rhodococcus (in: high G+C Gram-positive bacteria)]
MVPVHDPAIARWADKNGYGSPIEFDTKALKKIKPRTRGLYLLEFPDGKAYIGISIDIAARLAQHRRTYGDVLSFRLRPEARDDVSLRVVERALVHSAQRDGLVLLNREHSAVIVGETQLDSIVTPGEQREWEVDPVEVNRRDGSLGPEYTESQLAAHERSYDKLLKHPRHAEVIAALGMYLDRCVPFPARTEATFWTVSCYPGSSNTLLLRVSMAMLETFFIWENPDTKKLTVRMFVDGRHLPKRRKLALRKPWRSLSKHVRVGPRGHLSAGVFEQTVEVDDIGDLGDAFDIPGVARSAGSHALAVMRKKQSGYKTSHSPQLATAAGMRLGLEDADVQDSATPMGDDAAFEEPPLTDREEPANSGDEKKFGRFVTADPQRLVRDHLRSLLDHTLGDRSDVGVSWGLSLMPGTSAGKGKKRLYTLNVGQMEVAWAVRSTRAEDPPLLGGVVVSASELEARAGESIAALEEKYPLLGFHRRGYAAAHGDDVTVDFAFDDAALAMLDALPWRAAASVLIDTIRTSKSPWARYHSDVLLQEVSSSASAAETSE